MPTYTLIADSGATKTTWCLLGGSRARTWQTEGISPYFMSAEKIGELLTRDVASKLKTAEGGVDVYYYGTGCGTPENVKLMKKVLKASIPGATVSVHTDLLAAAHATCGSKAGIACILGTGSNSGYYNGKRMERTSPGTGYILGDEGSGAYLGKKVVQYFLYGTFDEELQDRFRDRFGATREVILHNVYREPQANRYLATFALFLAENRGHYMVENILEDGLNDFFFYHLCKYREVWKHPVHFVGSVAKGFEDVLNQLCSGYGFELGTVHKAPMDGLRRYYQS